MSILKPTAHLLFYSFVYVFDPSKLVMKGVVWYIKDYSY